MCLNDQRQSDQICSLVDLGIQLSLRIVGSKALLLCDQLISYEDTLDARHPKLADHVVCQKHNARRLLAQLHLIQRRSDLRFDRLSKEEIALIRLLGLIIGQYSEFLGFQGCRSDLVAEFPVDLEGSH